MSTELQREVEAMDAEFVNTVRGIATGMVLSTIGWALIIAAVRVWL